MPDYIAEKTVETIHSLVTDLREATAELEAVLLSLREPADDPAPAQVLVESILDLDEQISRVRLLLPLCTTGVIINEDGRTLSLSELITEIRSEFDSLARAQLEVLIEGSEQ